VHIIKKTKQRSNKY